MTEKQAACVDPGAVQDWELEAYADGDASTHVVEHLRRCAACRFRLAENLAVDGYLQRALYRFDCPSVDLLRDYHWGYLPIEQQKQIRDHLDRCPRCAAELEELRAFVPTDVPGKQAESIDALLGRARQVLAQARVVVAHLLSPVPQQLPALRGDIREVLLFDAGEVALSVNLEQEATSACTVFGQVLSTQPGAFSEGYARLTAYGETADGVQASLDINGAFVLANLRPGTYQLVVSLPDQRIVVPTLALNPEP